MKIKMFLMIALLSAIASDVFGGWVFVQNSEGDRQTLYVQSNKMKLAAADHIMIFEMDENMICLVTPKEKTYWKGTPEAFSSQVRKGMENFDKIMEQQLARIPARQRDAFKRTIRQQIRKQISSPPPQVEVISASQSDTIAGYKVRKYEIRINRELRQEQWIAEDIRLDKEFDVNQFGKMMRTFHSGFGQGGEDAALSSPQVIALLNKGWPLKKADYDEEGYRETEEVTMVEKKSLSPSVFAPPKGYRQISMEDIFGK